MRCRTKIAARGEEATTPPSRAKKDGKPRGHAQPPIPGGHRFADEKRKHIKRQARQNRHGALVQIQPVRKLRAERWNKWNKRDANQRRNSQQCFESGGRFFGSRAKYLIDGQACENGPAKIIGPDQAGAEEKQRRPASKRLAFQVLEIGERQARDQEERKRIPGRQTCEVKAVGPKDSQPDDGNAAVGSR